MIIPFNPQKLLDLLLSNYTGDLSGCLVNCSSNGICYQDSISGVISCSCTQNFTGVACNKDMRACYSSPCLNGATCVDIYSNQEFKYMCICDPYYTGSNCEKKIDVCINEKCSSHGSCADVNNTATCKCFQSYFGDHCENEEESLKMIKKVIQTTSIIAIITLVLFYLIFVACDLHRWYIGRGRRRRRLIQIDSFGSKLIFEIINSN